MHSKYKITFSYFCLLLLRQLYAPTAALLLVMLVMAAVKALFLASGNVGKLNEFHYLLSSLEFDRKQIQVLTRLRRRMYRDFGIRIDFISSM